MRKVAIVAGVLIGVLGVAALVSPMVSRQIAEVTAEEIVVPVSVGIELRTRGALRTVPRDRGCTDEVHVLGTPSGSYEVSLNTGECEGRSGGNGHHGTFSAPLSGAEVESIDTPLGEAVVFQSPYYECTNSCEHGTDEVALVTVDEGVIQVVATSLGRNGTTRSRGDLADLLQGLRRV